MKRGMLVDYKWCTGCHSCEIACQMKNELPVGQYGIKLTQVGPWQVGETEWQYDYIPAITRQCNYCVDRLAQGKEPTCVSHCQANCLKFVTPEEAASAMATDSGLIYMVR